MRSYGFVESHCCDGNLVDMFEVTRYCVRWGEEAVIVTMDVEAAFDNMSHAAVISSLL